MAMERPDMTIPPDSGAPGPGFRMVARTKSIDEADRIAEQYESQGFDVRVIKRAQAGLAIYEVWITKTSEIIT